MLNHAFAAKDANAESIWISPCTFLRGKISGDPVLKVIHRINAVTSERTEAFVSWLNMFACHALTFCVERRVAGCWLAAESSHQIENVRAQNP